ncbi:YqiA/YcfP family alpha/beta fold hydrolase [Winogradskyella vidalii]|uniref:YqiA/YcfP family alpha/beta fold hydrolase n=1 Tax=Winogradskyella vidalii TaxID=2615024 RepID=UPI0015CC9162|nr:YqiA/YcfP family alpha/beta fold hydrolase [Winogradskyella vidalii]
MNILYIHGLNSSLSPEKRLILEQYGKVVAPSIDYENAPNSISEIITSCSDITFNVVMGSSMGGFAGYYVSNHFQCPALLFNPALAKRPVEQHIPEFAHQTSPVKHIVLGTEDDVVSAKDSLQFIADTVDLQPNIYIHLRNHLAHRIPIAVFKAEVEAFFNQL